MVQLEVLPGDEHYLWFCAIITVALQLSCFAVRATRAAQASWKRCAAKCAAAAAAERAGVAGPQIAFSCKFDTITDFSGSTNFVLLALLTLSFGGWCGVPTASPALGPRPGAMCTPGEPAVHVPPWPRQVPHAAGGADRLAHRQPPGAGAIPAVRTGLPRLPLLCVHVVHF